MLRDVRQGQNIKARRVKDDEEDVEAEAQLSPTAQRIGDRLQLHPRQMEFESNKVEPEEVDESEGGDSGDTGLDLNGVIV